MPLGYWMNAVFSVGVERIPDLHVNSEDAWVKAVLDMIRKMLCCTPSKRISIAEVCRSIAAIRGKACLVGSKSKAAKYRVLTVYKIFHFLIGLVSLCIYSTEEIIIPQ